MQGTPLDAQCNSVHRELLMRKGLRVKGFVIASKPTLAPGESLENSARPSHRKHRAKVARQGQARPGDGGGGGGDDDDDDDNNNNDDD
ncbi:uncharacterized protein PG986_013636 [Apiospora aurea]|uniref:Uncharacterized protein n=1 Tax=Apiospora aurea TaxID=335848 RepID=A0ABR1PW53_9PEZI